MFHITKYKLHDRYFSYNESMYHILNITILIFPPTFCPFFLYYVTQLLK